MNLLHTIGLMTRAEHEAELARLNGQLFDATTERSNILSKFKRAATDLAAQADRIAKLTKENERLVRDYATRGDLIEAARTTVKTLEQEIAALRPDAEAMRKKRAADRKPMAGKRNG